MKLAALLMISFTGYGLCAAQTGTNYNALAGVVDAGGLRSASASYANDGSVGGFGGIVTAGSPQAVARVGFAGQLYETTGFTLTAITTNLNEGTSLALNAVQFIDDGTVSLASGSARWTGKGPIESINDAGVVTAASVYQDTSAVVQAGLEGWAATINLMVRNVGNDDYGVYAGDLIPDWWQVQFFGTNNPGGTGPNALFKYVAGLDPTNPASVFSINMVTTNGTPGIAFSPRWTNRTYTVEYATSPAGGNFLPLNGTQQRDSGNTRTVVDLNATNATRFYRVQITYP
jgi:hypothetical protein